MLMSSSWAIKLIIYTTCLSSYALVKTDMCARASEYGVIHVLHICHIRGKCVPAIRDLSVSLVLYLLEYYNCSSRLPTQQGSYGWNVRIGKNF